MPRRLALWHCNRFLSLREPIQIAYTRIHNAYIHINSSRQLQSSLLIIYISVFSTYVIFTYYAPIFNALEYVRIFAKRLEVFQVERSKVQRYYINKYAYSCTLVLVCVDLLQPFACSGSLLDAVWATLGFILSDFMWNVRHCKCPRIYSDSSTTKDFSILESFASVWQFCGKWSREGCKFVNIRHVSLALSKIRSE